MIFVQPTRNEGRAILLLLDFAPDEVYRARSVARSAVGSYPTFSPLPKTYVIPSRVYRLPVAFFVPGLSILPRRFVFCGPVCRLSAPGGYPASCSLEPGLSSIDCSTAMAQPACPTPLFFVAFDFFFFINQFCQGTGLNLVSLGRVHAALKVQDSAAVGTEADLVLISYFVDELHGEDHVTS